MNLSQRGPLGQKQPKPKADPAYLARVRTLSCCVCEAFGINQIGPTFSHHVICGRFSQRKTPDRMAIPLCHLHHQGANGIHTDKSAWVQEFGEDHEYSAATLDKMGV